MKKVLVAIPNYNDADLAEDMLQHLSSQTNQDFDVVICDDCSTDDSLEQLRCLKDNYNFKLMTNSCNLGIGRTLNNIIENNQHDYVTWFGMGDVPMKDYIEEHLSNIKGYDASASAFRHLGHKFHNQVTIPDWSFRNYSYTIGASYMFSWDTWLRCGPYSALPGEDFLFWAKAKVSRLKVAFTCKVLKVYLWRNKGVSNELRNKPKIGPLATHYAVHLLKGVP